MRDSAKCTGEGCAVKELCMRYTMPAADDDLGQWYLLGISCDECDCKFFVDNDPGGPVEIPIKTAK